MFPLNSMLDMMGQFTNFLAPFHEGLMVFLTFILTLVFMMLLSGYFNPSASRTGMDGQDTEIVWTLLPGSLLLLVALPSLRLLYSVEETLNPLMSIKVMGHQWYWTYYYPTFSGEGKTYDSFMTPSEDLEPGQYRLLEATPHAVLPYGEATNVAVSSSDVLHSWAIPALGVKLDAIPGRLNKAEVLPLNPGIYYGQCSEICGANHSFMPITLEAVSPNDFYSWLNLSD